MNISVVIPVRNGAATLERCLESILRQTLPPSEIIVLDTASSDGSSEIALRFGAQVIDIEPAAFDHGLTRNEGVRQCTGELIYFSVQDAWIAEDDMFHKMAKHFSDPTVMAVCGHQAVPHEKDKNPAKWYRRYSPHNVHVREITDREAFEKMPQPEQQALVAWDNVVAMYRRSALTELPFVQTEMAEDWVWSYQALMKGWKLLRDSSLIVYHYHHWTARYAFQTAYSIHYHFLKFLNYQPSLPPLISPTLKTSYHLIRNQNLSPRSKFIWIAHNISWRLSDWYAVLNFLLRLNLRGKQDVQRGYNKYCKTIPQGKQKQEAG